MGDYFQTLVVQDVELDEAADFAERVRALLVKREIVHPQLSKDHVLSGVGHAPGPKWRRAASAADGATPEGLLTNGVAIEVGRALHGFGAMSLVCPSCRAEQPMGPEWNAAEAAYVERGKVFMVACSSCRAEAPSSRPIAHSASALRAHAAPTATPRSDAAHLATAAARRARAFSGAFDLIHGPAPF